MGLYTGIHHEFTQQAINYFLDNFPNDLHLQFPKTVIIKAADLVLKNNTLSFDYHITF